MLFRSVHILERQSHRDKVSVAFHIILLALQCVLITEERSIVSPVCNAFRPKSEAGNETIAAARVRKTHCLHSIPALFPLTAPPLPNLIRIGAPPFTKYNVHSGRSRGASFCLTYNFSST